MEAGNLQVVITFHTVSVIKIAYNWCWHWKTDIRTEKRALKIDSYLNGHLIRPGR